MGPVGPRLLDRGISRRLPLGLPVGSLHPIPAIYTAGHPQTFLGQDIDRSRKSR